MTRILKYLVGAVGVGVIAFLSWNGFVALRERGETPPVTVVQVGPAVIERVRDLRDISFAQHNVAVDITHREAPSGGFAFLEKIGVSEEYVMLVHGSVEAGFDLSQMKESDIWVSSDRSRVQITLPQPIIFEDRARIDLQQSRILAQSDRCPGFFCSDNLESYRGEIEPEARRRIIAAARENGILDQATANGERFFEELLVSLGFERENIRIVVSDSLSE